MPKRSHTILTITAIAIIVTLTGWDSLSQPLTLQAKKSNTSFREVLLPTLTSTPRPTPISPLPTPTHTPAIVSPLITPTQTRVPTFPTAIATHTPTVTNTPTVTPIAIMVRVEGKVLDAKTQKGVADVLMTLAETSTVGRSATSLLADGRAYTTTTDLNGIFVFLAVTRGTYIFHCLKAGVLIVAPAPLAVSGDQPIQVPPLSAIIVPAKLYLPLVRR